MGHACAKPPIMDVPARTPASLVSRIWTSLLGWFGRASPPMGKTDTARPVMGADYAQGMPSKPGYDVEAAMSAYAAFPWVYAAAIRASRDFAGLPLVVVKGRRSDAVVLSDHPLYDLLEQTSLRVTGRQYRAQQWLDLTLAGNSIGFITGRGRGTVLQRLHPRRVSIETDPQDGWGRYIWEAAGGRVFLSAESIVHVRTPSWSDDPRGLWGTGAIEALHNDLNTDKRASMSASILAKRGRPDIIISPGPDTPANAWNQPFRDALRASLNALLEEGGTVVVGAEAKIDMPSWSPRDIEFPALRQLVREAVLAVTGVPPHLVGLPVANYAQAEAQERAYWERLQSLAGDVEDACWRPVARRFGSDISVRHDFSKVDVLQAGRTLRQQRVQSWWMMGISLADAAAYEGFEDLPTPPEAPAVPTTPGAPAPLPGLPDVAVADSALNGAQIASLLQIVFAVANGQLTVDAAVAIILVSFPMIDQEAAQHIAESASKSSGDEASKMLSCRALVDGVNKRLISTTAAAWFSRAFEPIRRDAVPLAAPDTGHRKALWENWITEAHTPGERRMQGVMVAQLKAQAARIVERLGAQKDRSIEVQRNADSLLRLLFPDTEDAAMMDGLIAEVRALLLSGFTTGAKAVQPGLSWNPKRLDAAVKNATASLVTQINETTRQQLREILAVADAAGSTTAEIQTAIQQATSFSPSRALMVARTEATRNINAGSIEAYRAAGAEGVDVQVQWLSAHDSNVRPSHAKADGQVIDVGGMFKLGDGDEGPGPGQMGKAENCINCRCTVAPKIKEKP